MAGSLIFFYWLVASMMTFTVCLTIVSFMRQQNIAGVILCIIVGFLAIIMSAAQYDFNKSVHEINIKHQAQDPTDQ